MNTRTRELAKVGIFGTVDNPVVVSERDLAEIVETFPDIKKAPVSLNGHWPDPAKPRLGNVVSVNYDTNTKTLSGSVEEQDALASVVDQGYFPDVSIGAKRRASDGRMYLHHLAYLGEEPPAVKDLVAEIGASLEAPAVKGIAAADWSKAIRFPSPGALRIELADIANQDTPPLEDGGNQDKKEAPMRTLEMAEADLVAEKGKSSALAAEVETLKGKMAKISEKYPEEGLSLSDADPRVPMLMKQVKDGKKSELMKAAAGKFPKGKEPLLSSLADSLSANASIELSDSSTGTKRSLSQIELLAEVFAAILEPVAPGRLDLADPGTDDKPLDLSKIKGKY